MYDQTQKSAGTATDKAATLNDRLNKTLNTVNYQCERLESVLSRVNGTPQRIESAKSGTPPTPMLSMQGAVENLEVVVQRLVDLTNGVERIA